MTSLTGRAGETPGRIFFRTERFFTADGQWHFATREGVDVGPFPTRRSGEEALHRYLETQRIMQRLQARDPTIKPGEGWHPGKVAEVTRELESWRRHIRDGKPEKER